MLSATTFELNMTMACGHEQVNKLRYRTTREKAEQMSDYTNIICDECRAKLRGWMSEDNGSEKFAMDFPGITGTEKRVKWAQDIRKARFEKVGALMLALSRKQDSILAKTAWKSLYLMMMVTDAVHWIENRNLVFTDLNLAFEVSNLMKDPGRNKGAILGNGSYHHFRERAPYVLERIALFDPAILPAVDVMPTIYT